jgi:hypothetical protein
LQSWVSYRLNPGSQLIILLCEFYLPGWWTVKLWFSWIVSSRNLVPGHLKYSQNPAKFFNGKFCGPFRFVPRGAAASGLLEFPLLTSGPGIFPSPILTVLSPDPEKVSF